MRFRLTRSKMLILAHTGPSSLWLRCSPQAVEAMGCVVTMLASPSDGLCGSRCGTPSSCRLSPLPPGSRTDGLPCHKNGSRSCVLRSQQDGVMLVDHLDDGTDDTLRDIHFFQAAMWIVLTQELLSLVFVRDEGDGMRMPLGACDKVPLGRTYNVFISFHSLSKRVMGQGAGHASPARRQRWGRLR